MKVKIIFFALGMCLMFQTLIAQISFTTTYTGFTEPTDITNAGDGSDRLFVVEKAGVIKTILPDGTTMPTDFLDISGQVSAGGERGLLGLTFHPNYKSNGFFFVNYTNNSGDTEIARFWADPTDCEALADPASEVTLMTILQPFTNHNAGDLNFGPDGYLYIATGDGGSGGDPGCRAQDPLNLLGKMLRLDVDQNVNSTPFYGIPVDNPYLSNPDTLNEIWSVGLRNPWRFSFDRENGDLWIADVGQNVLEEVHYIAGGGTGKENYGWKVKEGTSCFSNSAAACNPGTNDCSWSGYIDPIFEYGHDFSTGGFSITGGFVYRGCKYPDLDGLYICSDYVSGNTWLVEPNGNATFFNFLQNNIACFGEDEDGEIYAGNLDNGTIYQLTHTNMVTCVCPANDQIGGTIPTNTYTVNKQITSDGTVPNGGNVTYQANCILLKPDFEVQLNGQFTGEIAPCTPALIGDKPNQ